MPLNNKPVSYLQTDSRWASWPYSNKDENTNIAKSGCGPTAMAMVIATWVDSSVTPVTTCQWALSHGYKATGNGTYHSYFVPQAAAYGLECYRVNTSSIAYMSTSNANKYHQEAHDAVDEGHLVICLMGKGNWTSGGHYILWYSNDGDDVLINDPNSTKSTRVRNKWSLLKSQVRYYWVVKVPEEVISMISHLTSWIFFRTCSDVSLKQKDTKATGADFILQKIPSVPVLNLTLDFPDPVPGVSLLMNQPRKTVLKSSETKVCFASPYSPMIRLAFIQNGDGKKSCHRTHHMYSCH